jgi:predicted nucleotidyltransferase
MTDDVRRTVDECKALLTAHYGSKLKGVLLYGSTARGEDALDSDIDLLVLLEEPFDFFRELRAIVDLMFPLELECDRSISARPASVEEYDRGAIELYRNAKEQGALI